MHQELLLTGPYVIFDALENPRSVPVEAVTEIVFFRRQTERFDIRRPPNQ
jgi:hypothetical protein